MTLNTWTSKNSGCESQGAIAKQTLVLRAGTSLKECSAQLNRKTVAQGFDCAFDVRRQRAVCGVCVCVRVVNVRRYVVLRQCSVHHSILVGPGAPARVMDAHEKCGARVL